MIVRYRPSNGTEGHGFEGQWCDQCERNRRCLQLGSACPILLRANAFDIDDAEYPREWQYDLRNRPICTAFVPFGNELPLDRCEHTGDLFAQPTEGEQQ